MAGLRINIFRFYVWRFLSKTVSAIVRNLIGLAHYLVREQLQVPKAFINMPSSNFTECDVVGCCLKQCVN